MQEALNIFLDNFKKISFNMQSQVNNPAIYQIVSDFCTQYAQHITTDDAMPQNMTQMLWYKLQLMQNRLRDLGIRKAFEMKQTPTSPAVGWACDGKYLIAAATQTAIIHRDYFLKKKKIRRITDKGKIKVMVAEAMREEQEYTCPNCGAQGTLESLLDGCDYCHTKFQLEDFARRVSAFSYEGGEPLMWMDIHQDRIRKRVWSAIGLFVVLGFIGGYLLGPALKFHPYETAVMGLAIGPIVCMFTFFFYVISSIVFGSIYHSIKKAYRGNKRDYTTLQFERDAKKHDSLFSSEIFFSNLENKLIALHFAKRTQQIEAFAHFDSSKLIQRYQNVVECTLIGLNHLNYTVDELVQIARLNTNLELLVLENGRLKRRWERISLVLIKKRDCTTQAQCDRVVLHCKSCGASLNLLNGGVCEFCGTALALEEHDWVISDYIINE